jgi:hypothetical protein
MKVAAIVAVFVLAASSSDAARIHPSVHRALRQQGSVNIFVKFKAGTASALSSVKESNLRPVASTSRASSRRLS